MKVKFTEGPPEVTLDAANKIVERGEEIEVDDALGKQLLAQGWVEAGSHKKAAKAAPHTPVKKEQS